MTVKELADLLHNAGLNAYQHPQSSSGEEWNAYREKIATYLIREMQHKVWKASREQHHMMENLYDVLSGPTPIKGDH
jgi:hypothetical protein